MDDLRHAVLEKKAQEQLNRLQRWGLYKQAAIGGKGLDLPYEQALANIARVYVQDRAPSLMDYEIGFQLLDRNEEGDRAVGILAFRVGKRNAFVPIFFLHGRLKGHDILYLPDQDLFVPLLEGWVNTLMGQQERKIGDVTTRERLNEIQQPNLYPFRGSQYKAAMLQHPVWGQAIRKLAKVLAGDMHREIEHIKQAINLPLACKYAGLSGLENLVSFFRRYPQVAAVLREKYGSLDFVEEGIKAARQRRIKAASVLSRQTVGRLPRRLIVNGKLVQPQKRANVQVIFREQRTIIRALPLDDVERIKLGDDGFLIRDSRPESEKPKLEKVDRFPEVTGVSDPGVYDVVDTFDSPEPTRSLVLPGVQSPGKTLAVVVPEGSKSGYLCDTGNLLRLAGDSKGDWRDKLRSFPKVTEGVPRAQFAVVCERNGKVHGMVLWGCDSQGPGEARVMFHSSGPRNIHDPKPDRASRSLVIRDGRTIATTEDAVYVPADARVIPLEEDAVRSVKRSSHRFDLSVQRLDNSTFLINEKKANLRQLVETLVYRYGLGEREVKQVIKEAGTRGNPTWFRVKQAIDSTYMGYGGGAALPPTEGVPGSPVAGMLGFLGPSQQPLSQTTLDRSLPISSNKPQPELEPTERATLQRAMQTGQKEVIEAGSLLALLDRSDPTSIIEEVMPSWIKAMSGAGRVLFMLRWHMPAFADRFGKRDLPEVEDWLQNLFELLGKAVLYFKEKTIEPYPDEGAVDMLPSEELT